MYRCKRVFGVVAVGRFLIVLSALQLGLGIGHTTGILAIPCEIAWTANPDPTVGGYAVYYSAKGSSFTNRVDAGTNCIVTLADLEAATNYSFCVASYDTNGLEGSPSDEIDYAPPALTTPRLTFMPDGSAVVQFRAGTGELCHAEYSTSLFPPQWQWLSSATADSNGFVTITDRVESVGSRFYRVVEP